MLHIFCPSVKSAHSVGTIQGLVEFCAVAGARKLEHMIHANANDSHVCIMRNRSVAMFLGDEGADAMMFIDDDVGFRGSYIADMYEMNLPLVGCTYPRKQLNFSGALEAALEHGTAEALKRGLFDYNLRVPDPAVYRPDKQLVEASSLPTGFLMIRRGVFEAIESKFPDGRFSNGVYNFFGYGGYNSQHKWERDGLGEDYYFSALARAAGVTPWLWLGGKIDHYGVCRFEGFDMGGL